MGRNGLDSRLHGGANGKASHGAAASSTNILPALFQRGANHFGFVAREVGAVVPGRGRDFVLRDARRIVVKVGSSLVTNEGRGLDESAIATADLVAKIPHMRPLDCGELSLATPMTVV